MKIVCDCPTDLDELTELYCLGRLRLEKARRFEEHLAVCPACLYEYFDTDRFLESMLGALSEFARKYGGQLARQ